MPARSSRLADYVCVGDHVGFHDGTGFDGLTAATAALCGGGLPVLVGVYLLACAIRC